MDKNKKHPVDIHEIARSKKQSIEYNKISYAYRLQGWISNNPTLMSGDTFKFSVKESIE